jgi:hypothetical protein
MLHDIKVPSCLFYVGGAVDGEIDPGVLLFFIFVVYCLRKDFLYLNTWGGGFFFLPFFVARVALWEGGEGFCEENSS